MDTTRNWLLPALLAALQAVLLWAGPALTGGKPLAAAAVAGVLAATAAGTAALGWRRRMPVRALAGVLAASVVGESVAADWYVDIGLMVALYSVAARCGGWVTVRATAAVVGCHGALSAVREGMGYALAGTATLTAVLFAVCAGLGEARRHWVAGRWTATQRLVRAEKDKGRAADDERHRLARELHDVSAHHLTSVVVTVEAARKLGGQRPELAEEALRFAEDTGRETLTALQRLVAVLHETGRAEPEPMTGPVRDLVAAFGRLGRPIAADLPDDLAGPAAEALFGILREALTNALRYAPGAAVRVRVRRDGGALDMVVDNDAPRGGGQGGTGLGSGRGIAGMRERAAAVGGDVTAGPAPHGGWQVRARLPDATGPRQPAPSSRRRLFLRRQRLADAAPAFTAAVLPVLLVLLAAEEGERTAGLSATVLLLALTTVHALPLLWRRRAPWAALWAVAATALLWPAARAAGLLPSPLLDQLPGAVAAEAMAVYAVAAYGRGAGRTWPAAPVAAFGFAAAVAATAGVDGSLMDGATSPMMFVWAWGITGVVVCPVLAALWGAGTAVRTRRLRVLAREEGAFSDSVRQAAAVAVAERLRIAQGLHQAVLGRTTRLVELAALRRLDDVAVEARSALAAMRELLQTLRPVETGAGPDGRAPGSAGAGGNRSAGGQAAAAVPAGDA
ncbi:histidine kinase [Streptomyces sp. NPDC094143]|uniref:histidine kinase n=1 Tax=Streptomyces sp. NPDC094143 TaxID=3155310 RepID=UPI0033205A4A